MRAHIYMAECNMLSVPDYWIYSRITELNINNETLANFFFIISIPVVIMKMNIVTMPTIITVTTDTMNIITTNMENIIIKVRLYL